MIITVNKTDERANLPRKIEGNTVYEISSVEITTEVGEDARLILVYHTGISLDIPVGYMGIITPNPDIAKKSIMLTDSARIITHNDNAPITLKFKVNTDSVPSIFKPGEYFAHITVVPCCEVDYELASNEEVNSTDTNDVTEIEKAVEELNNDTSEE